MRHPDGKGYSWCGLPMQTCRPEMTSRLYMLFRLGMLVMLVGQVGLGKFRLGRFSWV